jgi:RNA recognition motif-containing protein
MAYLQKTQNKNKDYHMVVKAVPGDSSISELKALFETHDEIIDFIMPRKIHKKSQNARCGISSNETSEVTHVTKGFCFITFRHRATVQKVLKLGSIYFKGRLLNIEEYFSDKESRESNNKRNNQRRVFAKNLPPQLSTNEAVRNYFERYGPIDNTHVIANKIQPALHPTTADIFFKKVKDAQNLLNSVRQISVDGSVISIECYEHGKDKHKIKTPQTGNVLPDHSNVKDTDFQQTIESEVIECLSRDEFIRIKVPFNALHSQAADGSGLDTTAFQNLTLECHGAKPTSKSYHQEFKQYVQYHSHDNLRFNSIHPSSKLPSRHQISQQYIIQQTILPQGCTVLQYDLKY